MNRQRIIDKVKLRIDELGPVEGGELFGSEAVGLILDDAATRLLMIVPPYIPTPTDFAATQATPGHGVEILDGHGYLVIPEKFLKIVSVQMDDWERPATKSITEHHPTYPLQKNPFTRGGLAKPVLVYRYDSSLGKVLEYYTSVSHTLIHAMCLIETVAEELDDILVEPLSWLTASILLETRGEAGEKAMAKVAEWIQLKSVV